MFFLPSFNKTLNVRCGIIGAPTKSLFLFAYIKIWCKIDRDKIFMLFVGRKVPIGKNCSRGFEYQNRGHSFFQYGPTQAGE